MKPPGNTSGTTLCNQTEIHMENTTPKPKRKPVMSQAEKADYLRIAATLCGYELKPVMADMLFSLSELILKKKGGTDMKQILSIKSGVLERHPPEKPKPAPLHHTYDGGNTMEKAA